MISAAKLLFQFAKIREGVTGGPIRLKGDVIIEKDLVVSGKINDK